MPKEAYENNTEFALLLVCNLIFDISCLGRVLTSKTGYKHKRDENAIK